MKNPIIIFLFVLQLCFVNVVFASVYSDSTKKNQNSLPALQFKWKPSIGLGIGNFSFFGDIHNKDKSIHPTESRIAGDLLVTSPLTDYLDINFYVLWGKISANERLDIRNLNFESRIRTGGLMLSYNFEHLLPAKPKRNVNPYFSIGIESLEFLSKADMYDANGNLYYYWSDGSIRDIDENSRNSYQSTIIQRDYVYETDLREQNLDGFGKYLERSWALPVSVGFDFHVSENIKMRFGTSVHYTFTDLIDNISAESMGVRQGKGGSDIIAFTGVNLRYNLMPPKEDGQDMDEYDKKHFDWDWFNKQDEDEDLMAIDAHLLKLDTNDYDKDKVVDFLDKCPQSPKGVAVGADGCPVDTDKDGVPDYRDKQLTSATGSVVDSDGVAMTPEEIEENYIAFWGGALGGDWETIYTDTIKDISTTFEHKKEGDKDADKKIRKYVVVLGSEQKGISANELHKYLSFSDFRTITRNDTTFYIVGNYDHIEDAIKTREQIEKDGIEAGVAKSFYKDKEIKTIDPNNYDQYANDFDPNSSVPDSEAKISDKAIFRVQIGAFSKDISPKAFSDVPELVYVTGKDGITRYYSGSFTDPEKAAKRKVEMLLNGYEGTFVVAFKEGEKVSLKSVGVNTSSSFDEAELSTHSINKKLVGFRVQLGAYKKDVPFAVFDAMLRLGTVEAKRDGDLTLYLYGNYKTMEEAFVDANQIIADGVRSARVVGDFNGKTISAIEAQKLLDQ